MIQFNDVTLSRGQQTLLEEATATIFPNTKVGLIGSNGCGKSTLFSLIKKELTEDKGEVFLPSKLSISHVAQEVPSSSQTALNFVLDGHTLFRDLENQLKQAEDQEDFMKVASLYHEWDNLDAAKIPVFARKILNGLGFASDQIDLPVSSFSGGWRVRLQLARTLLNPGELLLLDEPTNHLDLEAIIWLEKWCKNYSGTLVIIAHDITFLDNVVNNILHIEHKKIKSYKGNYTTFTKTRALQLALTQAQIQKQQKKREHLQSFINRFKAKASKAKQAQSRVKQLEKMEDIAVLHASSPVQFAFEAVDAPNPMIRISNGEIGYQEPLLRKVSLYLGPLDRIGLLGKNGQGKSTLLKVLAGELNLLQGEIHIASKLRFGYFAQHQIESLKLNQTPFEVIHFYAPQKTEQQIREYLGSFQFRQEKVYVKIGDLSGGERARLAFAILILQKPQIILLDEPTNHLDIEMREALILALQSFNGALLVVSHDRAFIDACCDKLILIHEGKVENYEGTLDDYTQWTMQSTSVEKKTKEQTTNVQQKEKRKLSNLVKKLEEEMQMITKELADIEQNLNKPHLYKTNNQAQWELLMQEKVAKQQQMQTLENHWLEALSELERNG